MERTKENVELLVKTENTDKQTKTKVQNGKTIFRKVGKYLPVDAE